MVLRLAATIGALVCFGLLATAAHADEADACQPDIHRLCDAFFPDEKLVAQCLVDRRADLSKACAEALANAPDDDGEGAPPK